MKTKQSWIDKENVAKEKAQVAYFIYLLFF